jgi:hypothetical protein
LIEAAADVRSRREHGVKPARRVVKARRAFPFAAAAADAGRIFSLAFRQRVLIATVMGDTPAMQETYSSKPGASRRGVFRSALAIAAVALAIVCSATLAPPVANAGSTDPVLVVGHASMHGDPSRVLELVGSWGFDDMLQLDYPLSVVVHQGSSYVRYPFGGPAVSGTFAGLSDGLTAGEIAGLEASGSPSASAAMSRLALHEMTLALPPGFPAQNSQTVHVVMYVSLPGEGTFLSNTADAGAGS